MSVIVIYRRAATFSLNFKLNYSENIDTYSKGHANTLTQVYTYIWVWHLKKADIFALLWT